MVRSAECHHIGPNLVQVQPAGIVEHIHRIAASRAHVDFQPQDIPRIAQTGLGGFQAEKFQVEKAAFGAKGFQGSFAHFAQFGADFRCNIVPHRLFAMGNLHDAVRRNMAGGIDRLGIGIGHAVKGHDLTIHKFFQDIVGRIGALLLEKFVQLGFILELMGAVCPHAVIWLGNDGPADSFGESLGLRYICRHTPAGGGDTGFLVVGFHHGFALKLFDLSGFNTGVDIKICPQAGILFQPIFIVAFYPVDLAILESEKAHGAQHFIIVFHVVHTVILGQCAFEQGGQRFVRGIANAKHIYAIGTQAVTKIPVIFREMR